MEATESQVLEVKGILCTDSRGGYDAIEVNESPLLGLSNMRAALQAFQLKDLFDGWHPTTTLRMP